ncbi:MAG: hypothetical protein RI905_754 [Pseudomonadota bacterium]|jgi:branched-subunit amino acid transport protein
MTSFETWIVIIGLAAITYITRGFFLLMGARVELGPTVQKSLRYAPAAALVAVIVPEIFFPPGSTELGLNNPQLWGGIASILGFLATKSMVLTIILGMIVYTGARFI